MTWGMYEGVFKPISMACMLHVTCTYVWIYMHLYLHACTIFVNMGTCACVCTHITKHMHLPTQEK